ncbi:serine hydrolase [Oceanicola sp. 22II-s10i]|uniref:serine hydrolase domain-containing protein n=1 Tax=Oceanicola sp. 22II-s10i TaxID=1317116 RepID=UPI000B524F0B|nr:serine hydrolase domain-containing protein [Oceanicola sp. 22II-s10i]
MNTERLDAALDSALADKRIVGGVHLVSEGGETVRARAVGLADREAGRPMTPDTRIRLASLSKPVCTAVFMSLVEDGTLALDAPVTDHLPGFRPRLPDGTEPVITLHHLLTHTAGLGYRFLETETGPYAKAGISDGLDQPGLSMSENMRRIASAPLYYAPGTAWRYSVGIDVAGAVAEAATGKSMQALLDERIATPLGTTTLSFATEPAEDLATAYRNASPEPVPLQDGDRPILWGEGGVSFAPSRAFDAASFPSCGAGMIGSPRDMLTVLTSLAGHGPQVLKPETLELMKSPRIAPGILTIQGPGVSFGYGWGIVTDAELAATGQPAGTLKWGGVYGHSWFIDPTHDRVSVLMTNTAYEGMSGQLPGDIVGAFYR